MESKRIVLVGDLCPDMMVPYGAMKRRARLLANGEPVEPYAPEIEYKQGGSVGNVAALMGKFGYRPIFVSGLGNDYLSDFMLSELTEKGVDMSHCPRRDFPIPIVVGILDEAGEKTMFLSAPPGCRYAELAGEDLPDSLIENALWVHTSGMSFNGHDSESEAICRFIERAHRAGVTVSFDLNLRVESFGYSEKRRGFYERLLFASDVILGSSADEFMPLTGTADIAEAAELLSCGRTKTVVARDAQNPVITVSREGRASYPVPSLDNIVNKIGAGDAFTAAFIGASVRGCSLAEAVSDGITAAGYLITHEQPHSAAPELIIGL